VLIMLLSFIPVQVLHLGSFNDLVAVLCSSTATQNMQGLLYCTTIFLYSCAVQVLHPGCFKDLWQTPPPGRSIAIDTARVTPDCLGIAAFLPCAGAAPGVLQGPGCRGHHLGAHPLQGLL
jgi:hypothetical protein